jgi:hypothetical protein
MRSPSTAYTTWWRWTGRFPLEGRRNDDGVEMATIAIDFEVFALQAGGDVAAQHVGGSP